jgi:hypothetical protein
MLVSCGAPVSRTCHRAVPPATRIYNGPNEVWHETACQRGVVLCSMRVLVSDFAACRFRSIEQNSVEGTWQAVEVVHTGPRNDKAAAKPLHVLATHYTRVLVEANDRPVLVDPATATANQLRPVWGPFVAEGRHELTDSVITKTLRLWPGSVDPRILQT